MELIETALELIFLERPDWADGLEAKRALQTSKCTHTTWNLGLLMVLTRMSRRAVAGNTCTSINTTTQGEGICRYNSLMQTAKVIETINEGHHSCAVLILRPQCAASFTTQLEWMLSATAWLHSVSSVYISCKWRASDELISFITSSSEYGQMG